MAMIIDETNNILKFVVPNSEAAVNAQHNGIVDRTVGSYYMSNNISACLSFLHNIDGEFYVDFLLSLNNTKSILKVLKNNKYEDAFKSKLVDQTQAYNAVENYIENEHSSLYKIPNPTINENAKYLKFDNANEYVRILRTMALGDLTCLCIKRIGLNGYILYLDVIDDFDDFINSGKILKWFV